MHARARADVDQVVGGTHHRLVVLYDDHRVADVAQVDQRTDQARVVGRMQADGRLVADVEHAHQAGADLGREANALRLAAGERRGAAVQRQVVEADFDEEVEAGANLLEHLVGDGLLARVERRLGAGERREPLLRLEDAQRGCLRDVLVADAHRARLWLEARALAGRAGHRRHVALELLAHVLGIGLFVAARQVADHALELRVPAVVVAVAALEAHADGVGVAVEDDVELLRRQLAHGRSHAEAVALGDALKLSKVPTADRRRARPGHDGALGDAEVLVRDDELGVDLHLDAETGAVRTGAVRAVEAEVARRQLAERDLVVGAPQVLGVETLVLALDRDAHDAGAELERGLDRVGEAAGRSGGRRLGSFGFFAVRRV